MILTKVFITPTIHIFLFCLKTKTKKNNCWTPKTPNLVILGIKIGHQMAEKDFLNKKRDSVPMCNGQCCTMLWVILI